MARGGDEVKAGVNPRVMVVEERTFNFQFLLQVGLKLGINIFHYRLVARMQKSSFSIFLVSKNLQVGANGLLGNIWVTHSALRARTQVLDFLPRLPSCLPFLCSSSTRPLYWLLDIRPHVPHASARKVL